MLTAWYHLGTVRTMLVSLRAVRASLSALVCFQETQMCLLCSGLLALPLTAPWPRVELNWVSAAPLMWSQSVFPPPAGNNSIRMAQSDTSHDGHH